MAKSPAASTLDYSRFDHIGDSSEDEDEGGGPIEFEVPMTPPQPPPNVMEDVRASRHQPATDELTRRPALAPPPWRVKFRPAISPPALAA